MIDYAIYMLDPNGIVTNWNAGAQRIKGYAPDEIVGQHFSIFYTPEERAAGRPAEALATALREGKYEAEGWRVRKDGTRFFASVVIDPLYEEGVLAGFAKITRDITERETARNALLDSERNFRLLVSGVTDYALYMLDPEGLVSSWNAGGERIKGYTPTEIIGQHFSRFYTNQDQAAGRPARALSIARETGRYEEEGWRVRKDGSFFWASVVIDPIRDESGKLVGYAKITRDITERREAQMELARVQRQLAESQKMDALGQLTGGVAHDFNNLLMVVAGNIQTLKTIAAQDPKTARAAQAIEFATQRGAALTRQLLTFSRRQRVNPQPIEIAQRIEFDPRSSLQRAWRQCQADDRYSTRCVADHRRHRRTGNRPGQPRDQFTRCHDRRRHGDDLGAEHHSWRERVHCRRRVCRHRRQRQRRRHPAGRHRQCVRPVLHHEAGRQGHRPWTVAGARLRASGRRHREDHQHARPRHHRHDLSAAHDRRRASIRCRARRANAPARTGTVLLVEDNPEVASASANLLEQLGYLVRWVPNAEAALEEIERNGIDLVVSDIVMPGRMDGLGLARAIKEKRPEPADPARHRLQRGRAIRPRRFPDPAQALSDARAQPRARGDPAGRSVKRRLSPRAKKPGVTAGLSSCRIKKPATGETVCHQPRELISP